MTEGYKTELDHLTKVAQNVSERLEKLWALHVPLKDGKVDPKDFPALNEEAYAFTETGMALHALDGVEKTIIDKAEETRKQRADRLKWATRASYILYPFGWLIGLVGTAFKDDGSDKTKD